MSRATLGGARGSEGAWFDQVRNYMIFAAPRRSSIPKRQNYSLLALGRCSLLLGGAGSVLTPNTRMHMLRTRRWAGKMEGKISWMMKCYCNYWVNLITTPPMITPLLLPDESPAR